MENRINKYIQLDRLEFVTTWKCNSRCKHCSVAGKRASKPAVNNTEIATEIIKQLTSTYALKSFMTFGGEPLLFPEVICSIHEAAARGGIARREIITNAGWPGVEKKYQSIASKLANSGVTNIYVSVDAFHQEHILVDLVKRNVKELVSAGISVKWNPCWVISEKHDNPWNERTRIILDELSDIGVAVAEGNNVQPSGNALKWLTDFLPSKALSPEGTCEDVPYAGRLDKITSISIEPDGGILICNNLTIGNAGKQNILDILESYDPSKSPETKAILLGGTAGLAKYARTKGILPDPEGYYSICGKCVDLRRKLARIP
jgi:hypothetical protein